MALISQIFADRFAQDDFIGAVARCFVSVGLAPCDANGNYVRYVSHKSGISKAKAFRGVALEELSGAALLSDVAFLLDENDGQDDDVDRDGEDISDGDV